ncbi:MAG TPA: DUF2865 domain-containing protein [Methylocystis sp.]|nr:DUF2865 domain-containing protein [Methylocystis sp.]
MCSRSPSRRFASACSGLLSLIRDRKAVPRSLACLAAVLGLVALDAPRNRAQAFFFDDFGGSGFGYGDYGYSRGENEYGRRRHGHRSHWANEVHGRHRRDGWVVASDYTSPPGKAAYSTALPPGGAFSTPLFPRTVCVRACDGYAFGREAAYGGFDPVSREAACTAACPDAETKLFVLPAGVEDVVQARAVRVSESYPQLLAKFKNRENKPASCSCHVASSPNGDARALLSDPTLRQGDLVVTEKGVRVFLGGGALPHKSSEFLSLAHTSAVAPAQRGALAAIDKMLKVRPAHVSTEAEARPQSGAWNNKSPASNR